MPGVRLVHLASGSLGPAPTRSFVDSLRRHDAGCEFELLVVFNGAAERGPSAFAGALEGTTFDAVEIPDRLLDLAAYARALDEPGPERLCFVNSNAVVLADGWLARLTDPLAAPDIGLVGASGSWESAFSSAPLELRWERLRQFRRFPNPHLRTNAFAGRRRDLCALDWGPADTKLAALRLESGRRSLSRQVRARGLRVVVTGRDGALYEPKDWPRSATFRCRGQVNLLVADNRTDDYDRADPAERRRLGRMAWGRRWPGD